MTNYHAITSDSLRRAGRGSEYRRAAADCVVCKTFEDFNSSPEIILQLL